MFQFPYIRLSFLPSFCLLVFSFALQSINISCIPLLRVFENRVLRRIFGPKRDEVTGEWRKLHNEELRDLYF
jgi:hypothetical protein